MNILKCLLPTQSGHSILVTGLCDILLSSESEFGLRLSIKDYMTVFYLGLLSLCLTACDDSFQEQEQFKGVEESMTIFQCVDVMNDTYEACAGPGWREGHPKVYGEFQYFELRVSKKTGDKMLVLFNEDIDIKSVGPFLFEEDISEVVKFDKDIQSVIFDIKTKKIIYKLEGI